MYTQQSKPAFCFKHWSRQGFATFASLHKVVKIGVVTFTCSLVQVKYQAVFAQADSTEASVTDVPLQEVEVSAKQPMRWSELTHSVSVAGQKEIAASPVQSIDDMLETMPGVDIRQRGSDGVQSDISLNGGSFDQVLILLNGVNITDPQTGHYNLNIPIELSQIQRIEILRGSGARTLGSNAFCGAINFITDQPLQQNGLKGQAEIATGYWGFFKTAASIAYQKDAWQLDAGLSRNTSDGYTANTDYDILNSHIQSSWHNASAGHFLLQLGYQQKAFGANSFYSFKYPNQFDATKTLFSSFSWNKTVENTDWQIQVYERQHHDRFELFRDMENAPSWYTTHNYHLTNVNGGHFSRTVTTEHQKRLIGADIRHEQIVSNVLGEPLTAPKQIRWTKRRYLHTANNGRRTVSFTTKRFISENTCYQLDFQKITPIIPDFTGMEASMVLA
ncbi:MAG: TonB-dependent receptor plug domain-containing protein, partial [Bacteroidota bacterium]|nr:TonB-dependent receptor plug domain-containing protein [Bacteroidota bacterium]